MSTRTSTVSSPYDVSFVRLGSVLLRERYRILRFALLVTLSVATVALLRPRTWTVTATFMPQARRQGGNLQGLAAQFGLPLSIGESAQQSPAFYADVITSRAILAPLVTASYRLSRDTTPRPLSVLLGARGAEAAERRSDTMRRLEGAVDAWVSQKTGVVNLSVTTRDPELALQLADAMLRGLDRFNKQIRQSQATAERQFTELRLAEVRQELRRAEDAQQAFFQRNRAYEGSVPLRFQQERLAREVSVKQQLFLSMSEAYEQARIEEIRDTPVMTILTPPERPAAANPRGLALACAIAASLALLLAAVVAVLRDSLAGAADGASHTFVRLRTEALDDARHPIRALRRIVAPPRRTA